MFNRSLFAVDLPTVHASAIEATWPRPSERWTNFQTPDPIEQMVLAEAADRSLFKLVGCAALATLLLALATSMV